MFLEGRQWQVVVESSIRAVRSYWLWFRGSYTELFCGSLLGLRSGLFDHLFSWPLCLCTWELFSISIFSKILNLLLESTFSLLTVFCFGVIFVLSFCSFLFGEVSVEVGGLIGDLLSFGLVLEGDLSVTHLIGCVVDDSSMNFSRSVLTVEVCECAGVFTLSATRSAFVVGVSGILLVSSEVLISLI